MTSGINNYSASTYNSVQNKDLADIINDKTTKEQFITALNNSGLILTLSPEKTNRDLEEIMKKAIESLNCEILECLKEIVGEDLLSMQFEERFESSPLLYATYSFQAGWGPLASQQEAVVKKLIELGFPVNPEGQKPLEVALERSTDNIIDIILKAGGTMPEDAYNYTARSAQYPETMKEKYKRHKATLERVRKNNFERENNIQGATKAQWKRILCPNNHLHKNEPPEGILPLRDRVCPICTITPETIKYVSEWQRTAAKSLDLSRRVINIIMNENKYMNPIPVAFPIFKKAMEENGAELRGDEEVLYIIQELNWEYGLSGRFWDLFQAEQKQPK